MAAALYADIRRDFVTDATSDTSLAELTERLIAAMEAESQWPTASIRNAHLELIARHFTRRGFRADGDSRGIIVVTFIE